MKPTYPLQEIKKLISENMYRITQSALNGALELNLDENDICECICDTLTEDDFYKTMPSEVMPSLWQDVYKVRFHRIPIYLKMQINKKKNVVVISFKLE